LTRKKLFVVVDQMVKPVKIVVVGDGAVGKTCLLVVYDKGQFPTEYVPTVFDNYSSRITVDEVEYDVQLWDTAGQEDLETIRCLSYPDTDIFILCFSVTEKISLNNVQSMWLPELKRYATKPQLMLVATKADLRGSENEQVSKADAEKMARQLGALAYLECAAINNQGVTEVFEKAIQLAAQMETRGGGCCSVQ
jgi:small GTP-binding protein